jgi:hypothetical protein
MREESHLEDMRTALRGDFERLARRRGGQELMRARVAPPAPRPEPDAPERAAPAGRSATGRVRHWLTSSGRNRGTDD